MRLRHFESSPSMAMGPTPHVPTNSNTQKERTMRRLSIAFALSTLLLVTICPAQQTAQSTPANPAQHGPALPPGPILGGMGTAGSVAMFAASNFLVDSTLWVNPECVPPPPASPAGCVANNGAIDSEGSAPGYNILGMPLLTIFNQHGSQDDENLFVGITSGMHNTGTLGQHTFVGYGAGFNNTMGKYNTFLGHNAGYDNTTGDDNTFVGNGAGYPNVGGNDNTFTGYQSGFNSNAGNNNTFYGSQSGFNNTSGTNNTFLGINAGYNNTTGDFDIYIGNRGPTNNNAENDTIRIGNSTHTTTYIAGINNSMGTPNPPIQVACVDSVGLLFGATFGTQCTTSSRRFKEQVRDMGDSTNDLMKLRPVTFFYKPEYANGEHTLEYGLIAEEVAKVYPELVAYDKDGQPYTVRYQYIATMLLNEVQKQNHRAEAQADLIKAQQQEIDDLKQQLQVQNATLQERLSRLEALTNVERAAAH